MSMAEQNRGDIEGWKIGYRKIGRDEVRAVDVEPGQKVQEHQIMNAAGVPALQEVLVEDAIFAEVFAKVQEDAPSSFLKIDLISTDAVSPIIYRERYRSTPSSNSGNPVNGN
jgi:hypothetical protein